MTEILSLVSEDTSATAEPGKIEPVLELPAPAAEPVVEAETIAAVEAAPPAAAEPVQDQDRSPPALQSARRRRTLIRASSRAPTAPYDAPGKIFAGDYLRQTNEAFEAAHLKGKGPRFAGLRLADNHRAERLFMMATRTAGDDPSTALAAPVAGG